MVFALLQMPEVQICQLAVSKPAPKQDREYGAVSLTFQRVWIRRLPETARFLCGKPVPKPYAELLHAFNAPDTCGELGTKQASVGGLICQPTHSGKTAVNSAAARLRFSRKIR